MYYWYPSSPCLSQSSVRDRGTGGDQLSHEAPGNVTCADVSCVTKAGTLHKGTRRRSSEDSRLEKSVATPSDLT